MDIIASVLVHASYGPGVSVIAQIIEIAGYVPLPPPQLCWPGCIQIK